MCITECKNARQALADLPCAGDYELFVGFVFIGRSNVAIGYRLTFVQIKTQGLVFSHPETWYLVTNAFLPDVRRAFAQRLKQILEGNTNNAFLLFLLRLGKLERFNFVFLTRANGENTFFRIKLANDHTRIVQHFHGLYGEGQTVLIEIDVGGIIRIGVDSFAVKGFEIEVLFHSSYSPYKKKQNASKALCLHFRGHDYSFYFRPRGTEQNAPVSKISLQIKRRQTFLSIAYSLLSASSLPTMSKFAEESFYKVLKFISA